MNYEIIDRAIRFALNMHRGQKRKYSGIPYITHPIAVMEIVSTVEHTKEMLVAAILHDVVEDCSAEVKDVELFFGEEVSQMVEQLTDVSKPEDGNRATRKQMDAEHLALAWPCVKTIKLADLIHNSESIIRCDPEFAKVYIKEKSELLKALDGGDYDLMERAEAIVSNYNYGIQMQNNDHTHKLVRPDNG